jgi:hypothetical protein
MSEGSGNWVDALEPEGHVYAEYETLAIQGTTQAVIFVPIDPLIVSKTQSLNRWKVCLVENHTSAEVCSNEFSIGNYD